MSENKPEKELTAEEIAAYKDLVGRINHTLDKLRPYIQADGGDVQFESYKDGIVTVSMSGACAGCMAIGTTLTDGIEALLMDEVPEVKGVRLMQSDPFSFGYDGYNF